MPFFPDTEFGLYYLAALVVFGCIAWWGGKARALVIIMAAHWLAMRGICAASYLSIALWIAHDIAMILAMVFIGRSIAGGAIAVLFFVVMLFDQYALLQHGFTLTQEQFDATAAVGETVGYLSMLIMAGAGLYGGGKLERGGSGRFGLGGLGGHWGAASSAPSWRPISSRPGSAGEALARNPKAVP